MQRLAVHRLDQAPGVRQFLGAQRPAQAVGEQFERGLVGQAGQALRGTTATEDRPRGADHHRAAGQDVKEIADPLRIGGNIVNGDDGVDLTEYLRALVWGQLDRPGRAE